MYPGLSRILACILLFFLSVSQAQAAAAGADAPGAASTAAPGPLDPLGPLGVDEEKAGFTERLIMGARAETRRLVIYKSAYYSGGYPPKSEGVCTDLVWRAFRDAGIDLKGLIDGDIRDNPKAYPRVTRVDRNIDFRRVPNQRIFFSRHGLTLTRRFIPSDPDNRAQWQPGDIVTFRHPDHIGILSDRTNPDGVPLLLHNDGPIASEDDSFMFWYERGVTGHYRYVPPEGAVEQGTVSP